MANSAWQQFCYSAVMMEWICSQFGLLWGKAVPSKVCYHVAPSGAGGKECGGGCKIGRRVGMGKWKETGGELNSSSKLWNVTVSCEWAAGGTVMQGLWMWCVLEWMDLGGLTVTPHTSLSERGDDSAGLIEKDKENTAISSSPPVRRECKITWTVHRTLPLQCTQSLRETHNAYHNISFNFPIVMKQLCAMKHTLLNNSSRRATV